MIIVDNGRQIQFVFESEEIAEINVDNVLCRFNRNNSLNIRVFGPTPNRATLQLSPNQPTKIPWTNNATATFIRQLNV